MPPLPVVTAAQIIRALERAGFVQASQRGSHVKLKHAGGRVVIVPDKGSRSLQAGTLKSILRQADLSIEQFTTLLP